MKLDNKYPEPVKEICNDMINTLQEQNFFIREEANEQITFDVLCESIFPDFIKGVELLWEHEKLEKILNFCVVKSVVYKLEKDGILNTIEDENGETTVFMTNDQKSNINNIINISPPENNNSSK